MISEGSCDTDDWSNDAALHHKNKVQFTMYEIKYFLICNISQYYYFYCMFGQINAA